MVYNIPKLTDRAARSLFKLFNIDDQSWMEEMAEVEKLVFDLQDIEAKEQTKVIDKSEESIEDEVQKNYVMKHVSDLQFKLTAKTSFSS